MNKEQQIDNFILLIRPLDAVSFHIILNGHAKRKT